MFLKNYFSAYYCYWWHHITWPGSYACLLYSIYYSMASIEKIVSGSCPLRSMNELSTPPPHTTRTKQFTSLPDEDVIVPWWSCLLCELLCEGLTLRGKSHFSLRDSPLGSWTFRVWVLKISNTTARPDFVQK